MWDVDGGEGVAIFVLDVVGGVVRVLVGVVVVVIVVVALVVRQRLRARPRPLSSFSIQLTTMWTDVD